MADKPFFFGLPEPLHGAALSQHSLVPTPPKSVTVIEIDIVNVDPLQGGVQALPPLIPGVTLVTVLSGNKYFVSQAFDALSKGDLSPKFREQIALAVSEVNDCQYCLAAHSAIGRSVGLSEEAIGDSRRGESPDTKEATALAFTRNVVENRGWVSDEDVAKLRKVGFSQGDIVELIANISLILFTNYFNHVAETEIDFPAVSELETRV